MYKDIGEKKRSAQNTQKVGKYFFLKDSINCLYQNCLVYKYTSLGYLSNQYIGETERQLFVRIKEHVTPNNSVVLKHNKNCAF